MKIRTLTYFYCFQRYDDINDLLSEIVNVLKKANRALLTLSNEYKKKGYEVQTLRISFNSFEEWFPMGNSDSPFHHSRNQNATKVLMVFQEQLGLLKAMGGISFCSFGPATTMQGLLWLRRLLLCPYVNSSLLISPHKSDQNDGDGDDFPMLSPEDVELCKEAADLCISLGHFDTDINFRFAVIMNCPSGIPFFPASYADQNRTSTITTTTTTITTTSDHHNSIGIGLENGDLLFLAFHGMNSNYKQASSNLYNTLKQILLPIQKIAIDNIYKNQNKKGNGKGNDSNSSSAFDGVNYSGIDTSINPGLTMPDSVGAGLELLHPHLFGSTGSLPGVSAITAALKKIAKESSRSDYNSDDYIKTCGYCGLMLPVMEDIIMARRCAGDTAKMDEVKINKSNNNDNSNNNHNSSSNSNSFEPPTVRDLLILSSVCGVGVDTVPVAGDITTDSLANLYIDATTMAFRLQKPLSVRVLVMDGLQVGDMTNVASMGACGQYLCDTKVLSL